MKIAIPVIVGAIIGYVTNWLAIKMLFRPHEEKRILGLRIPFTPGLIPKERNRIAKSVGITIGEYLLSPDVVINSLTNNRIESHIKEWVESNMNRLKKEKRSIKDFMTIIIKDNYSQVLKAVKEKITGYICKEARKDTFKQKIMSLLDSSFLNESIENIYSLVIQKVELFLSELPYSSEVQELIKDAIEVKLNELKQDERKLNEIIPEDSIDAFKNFIHENDQHIVNILKDMLDDPQIEKRIKESIYNLVSSNMNRLIAMFVSPEMISDKFYGIIKDYINNPKSNEKIIDIIITAIDKILENRAETVFSEVSSIVGEEQISGISHSILSYVSTEKNRRSILDMIGRKIESQKLEIRNTILNLLYGKIEEILDSQMLYNSIYAIVDEFIDKTINIPVSLIVANVDEGATSRISSFFIDMFKYFIKHKLPRIVELFNISKVVEDEINSYDVAFAEKLIVEIAERELKAITWLGALLGGIMGMLSPLLQMIS